MQSCQDLLSTAPYRNPPHLWSPSPFTSMPPHCQSHALSHSPVHMINRDGQPVLRNSCALPITCRLSELLNCGHEVTWAIPSPNAQATGYLSSHNAIATSFSLPLLPPHCMSIYLHQSPAYPPKSPINQTDRLLAGSEPELEHQWRG